MDFSPNHDAQRLQVVLKAAHMCLFEADLKLGRYTCFANTEEIFGISADALLRQVQQSSQLPNCQYHQTVFGQFIHADDQEVAIAASHEIAEGCDTAFQLRIRHTKGTYAWCKVSVTPVLENGIPARAIGVISDIQCFRERAEKLAEEARIDNFTGLYHKLHFEKVAEAILQNHADQRHAVILIDLDNFEEFNKIYGKLRGDGVLRTISSSLRHLFPKPDIVGRFGGDEFIILMQNLTDDQQLQQKLEQLLRCDDSTMKVTKSIGFSIYPEDGAKFSDLLHQAELALHNSKQAKKSGALNIPARE